MAGGQLAVVPMQLHSQLLPRSPLTWWTHTGAAEVKLIHRKDLDFGMLGCPLLPTLECTRVLGRGTACTALKQGIGEVSARRFNLLSCTACRDSQIPPVRTSVQEENWAYVDN